MDLIIIIVLIAIVVIIRRDFKSFIYSLGAIEIFFRIMHFIADNLNITELSRIINTYIPSSIISVFQNYATDLFLVILEWIFVIFMAILNYYLIKYIVKKK